MRRAFQYLILLVGVVLASGSDDTGGCSETGIGDKPSDTGITEDVTLDEDGDGFDALAYGGTDCNDSDASVHPGAVEIPMDEVDNDCDGLLLRDQYLPPWTKTRSGFSRAGDLACASGTPTEEGSSFVDIACTVPEGLPEDRQHPTWDNVGERIVYPQYVPEDYTDEIVDDVLVAYGSRSGIGWLVPLDAIRANDRLTRVSEPSLDMWRFSTGDSDDDFPYNSEGSNILSLDADGDGDQDIALAGYDRDRWHVIPNPGSYVGVGFDMALDAMTDLDPCPSEGCTPARFVVAERGDKALICQPGYAEDGDPSLHGWCGLASKPLGLHGPPTKVLSAFGHGKLAVDVAAYPGGTWVIAEEGTSRLLHIDDAGMIIGELVGPPSFGTSLSIDRESGLMVVGAPERDTIYLFDAHLPFPTSMDAGYGVNIADLDATKYGHHFDPPLSYGCGAHVEAYRDEVGWPSLQVQCVGQEYRPHLGPDVYPLQRLYSFRLAIEAL